MSNMDFRSYSAAFHYSNSDILHFGILGMKWGVRRYQNKDGTLTSAGKKRYTNANNRAILADKYVQDLKDDEADQKDIEYWQKRADKLHKKADKYGTPEKDASKKKLSEDDVDKAINDEGFKDEGDTYTLFKKDGKDEYGLPKKDNKVDGDRTAAYKTYKTFTKDKQQHVNNIHNSILSDSHINEWAKNYNVSPQKLKSILKKNGGYYEFGAFGDGTGIVNFSIGVNAFGGHFITGLYDPNKKKTSSLEVEG